MLLKIASSVKISLLLIEWRDVKSQVCFDDIFWDLDDIKNMIF